MSGPPSPASLRGARAGLIAANGRLPVGWINENADRVEVEHVDLSPDGPAITLTIGFAATNPAPWVSLVLGDYLHVEEGEIATLRLDAEVSRARAVSAACLVMREWIAGGTYVGQTTREIAIGQGLVPATAARMATGHERLFQGVLTFRRDASGEGQVTARLRRVMLASLHDHPAWLAA